MDLEVREIPIQSRAMYNSRLKSYKQEVEKLEKDFVSTERTSLILINSCSNIVHIWCALSTLGLILKCNFQNVQMTQ